VWKRGGKSRIGNNVSLDNKRKSEKIRQKKQGGSQPLDPASGTQMGDLQQRGKGKGGQITGGGEENEKSQKEG